MNIIESLRNQIGSNLHTSEWLTIDQDRVDGFSKATGDFQWIHNDPIRSAKESPYGAPIAHGYLLLSLYPVLRGIIDEECPPYPGVKTVINYGANKCRFPQAVRVGQRIRGHAVLMAVESVPQGFQTLEKYSWEIEDEPKPACVAEILMRFYL